MGWAERGTFVLRLAIRGIAECDGITEGLVCILRALEPCNSFKLRRNHSTHRLDVVSGERKCVHHYWYFIDPELGFIHIRLQSWLPFGIQIYVNGREWLARQLDARNIGYVRADNAQLRIDDLEVAGELCERFAHRAWPRLLDALARRVNIHLPAIAAAEFRSYYWCLDRPRSPPTSCSATAVHSLRCYPTSSVTPA